MTGPRERTIFLEAAELDGAARASYLDEACGDDAALRSRVERLLAIDARGAIAPTTPLQPSAGASDDVAKMTLGVGVGDSIDGFKILEVIGEGGMGVVYLAEQLEPVKRRIALKVIKPGMDSKAVLARFEAERQALALMDHPGIARVLQAGTTDRGLPYFAMEYVKGVPITDAADRNQLDTTQRLELMQKVCDAVQHAHMKGIIHRDLKPSNILVTTDANDELVAKIIDFGVAKATAQQLTDLTVHTQVGHFIGTPAYMSPEQADLTAADIDTRTDVYSLGVILYELLTGQLPFDPAELREAGLEEMRRRIREDDPPKPSTRLTSLDDQTATRISKARRTRLDQLQKNLASELDWIPLKALRKIPSERYATPSDLARDLQRYLDGEPLEAGPESAGYRLRKFVKRRRIPIAVGGAFAAILVAATVVSVWLAVEASQAARRVTLMNQVLNLDSAQLRGDSQVEARARADQLLQDFVDLNGLDLLQRIDLAQDRFLGLQRTAGILKRWKIAIAIGELAISSRLADTTSPDIVEIHTGQSEAYRRLGKWDSAFEYLDMAQQLERDHRGESELVIELELRRAAYFNEDNDPKTNGSSIYRTVWQQLSKIDPGVAQPGRPRYAGEASWMYAGVIRYENPGQAYDIMYRQFWQDTLREGRRPDNGTINDCRIFVHLLLDQDRCAEAVEVSKIWVSQCEDLLDPGDSRLKWARTQLAEAEACPGGRGAVD